MRPTRTPRKKAATLGEIQRTLRKEKLILTNQGLLLIKRQERKKEMIMFSVKILGPRYHKISQSSKKQIKLMTIPQRRLDKSRGLPKNQISAGARWKAPEKYLEAQTFQKASSV